MKVSTAGQYAILGLVDLRKKEENKWKKTKPNEFAELTCANEEWTEDDDNEGELVDVITDVAHKMSLVKITGHKKSNKF